MAGDELVFGQSSVRVLWPQPDPPSPSSSGNDNSLALRVSMGPMHILLPGDTGNKSQSEMLSSGEALRSQVLLLNHVPAGSSRGQAFLAAVAPQVAIVHSVGESAGRPAVSGSKALEFLAAAGSKIFCPGIAGATTVEWHDGNLRVRTYRGGETVIISQITGAR